MLRISRWPRLWVLLEFSIIGAERDLGANWNLTYFAFVSVSSHFRLTFSAGFICALRNLGLLTAPWHLLRDFGSK